MELHGNAYAGIPVREETASSRVRLLLSLVMSCHTVTPLGLARQAIEDDEYKGYRIPKGTTVLPNVW